MNQINGSARRGFSLVEVVVAMAILAILLLGVAGTTIGAIRLNAFMLEKQQVIAIGESALNRTLASKDFLGFTIDADSDGEGDGVSPIASANVIYGGVDGGGKPNAPFPNLAPPGEPVRVKLLAVSAPDQNPRIEIEAFKYVGGVPQRWDTNGGTNAAFKEGGTVARWDNADYYVVRAIIRYIPITNQQSGSNVALTYVNRSVYYPKKKKP